MSKRHTSPERLASQLEELDLNLGPKGLRHRRRYVTTEDKDAEGVQAGRFERQRSSSPCRARQLHIRGRWPGRRRAGLDWLARPLLSAIDGVTRLLVPDNLKSGVKKASFYHPEINRSYGRMTEHYTVGVLPARPRKPRDKAPTQNLQHRLANSVRAWRRDIGKAGETYRRSARG